MADPNDPVPVALCSRCKQPGDHIERTGSTWRWTCAGSAASVAYPEPAEGSILLATTDRRVWVRTIFAWNSSQGWFGWSWDQLLDHYSPASLVVCTPGATVAEAGEPRGADVCEDPVEAARGDLRAAERDVERAESELMLAIHKLARTEQSAYRAALGVHGA